jgi:hypothetical protein
MAISQPHLSILKKLRADLETVDLSVTPLDTIKAVDARYSLSSSRVALTALRKEYPDNKVFADEMKKRYTTFRNLDEDQQPTQRQQDNFIKWDDLILFRDEYHGEMSAVQRILLALYTRIPPVRADYTPMLFCRRKPRSYEEGMNYIVWTKNPYFIFHAYKTHETYGDKIVKIPATLRKDLEEYFDTLPNEQRYLFESDGVAWSPTRLGATFRKIFQQFHQMDTGITLVRHAYLTKYHAGQKPLAELKKVASSMMHSTHLSQAYRFLSLE